MINNNKDVRNGEDIPGIEVEAPTVTLTAAQKLEFVDRIKAAAERLAECPIDLMNFGPWSPSKLKTLEKCPFQFFLKYVLKIKVPENFQIQSDPLSANVGKAAHLILEHVSIGKPIDKSYREARAEFVNKKILTPEQWVNLVEPLEYNISTFKERLEGLGRKDPIKRVLTELRIGVTRDYQATGFFSDDVWLRGVVDLVIMLECMDIIIIDHKTGGGFGGIRGYESQLDWYKILFHFGINKIEGAQTGIHFIAKGDVQMASYTPAKDIESKLKNLLEMSLEGAIDTMLEMGYFKHVRGSYCKWCEYDNLGCKTGELKPVEMATKKWIQIHKEENK